MTERFRVTLGNNTVRFVDFEENKQLMSISFKKHNDAVDCQNALKFQCDLLNELNDENKTFREALKELKEIGDYQEMRIKELDDENQFIKHVINEALSAERTELGKSVLKQLLDQME